MHYILNYRRKCGMIFPTVKGVDRMEEYSQYNQVYEQAPMMPKPEKKSGVGKRVGYFFLSLTPALACGFLQLVAEMAVMIVGAFIRLLQYMAENPTASKTQAMAVYTRAIYEFISLGLFAYHLVALPAFGLWYYFGCGRPKLKRSVRNVNVQAVVIAVIGGVSMCLFSNAMVGVEQYLLPKAMESYMELMELADIGNDLLTTLAAVLLAPIGEEILCRGLTLYYAKKALPYFWMANILQALLFGAIHGNLIQGLYAFAIGLVLGWLTERYHSLLPAMLLHFTVNFSSCFWIERAFYWIPDTLTSWLILLGSTLFVTLLLVAWGSKKSS